MKEKHAGEKEINNLVFSENQDRFLEERIRSSSLPITRNRKIKEPFKIAINGKTIKSNSVINLPFESRLRSRARELRKARNLPEVVFWLQVHKGKFHKIDFDRQRVIGNYIVDFYVKKLGLVIEIDGSSHNNKVAYDRIREDYLLSLGLKVFRLNVGDVMKNLDFAMMRLENYILEHYSAPNDKAEL